ncbi:FtsK/SpoIIIE domain-containing protein [Nocardiopsis sp. NPDC006198]|uniref:FtsK/SpoIIIE domain-containing protein n=1 Tax=Nocardiopsis sp. NPDC006198 TaxID=3154472 RepID=UPI0033AC0170
MGKKKQKKTIEWGHYGPISGPFTAACTSLAVAGWGDVVGLSPWYAVAGAGACGLLTLAMDVKRKLPVFARLTHLGAWAFHGWWTWGALAASTPYSVDGIATLATGTAVAVVAAQAASVHTENVREHLERVEEEERKDGIAGEWISRIKRVCNIGGVKVAGIDPWKRPVPGSPDETRETGYSVLIELPDGGYRWTDISSKRLEMVSSANLPTGCGIEVRPGDTAREVVIDVTTVNVLGEDLPLGPIERRSIYDPIPVGIRHDGSFLEVSLKWQWALLIGQTGSGKSNQLTAMLSYLLMCDDVLIFGIDFNGGKLFMPYLRPWLRGEAKKPAITAVATDEDEALAMLKFLIDVIPLRASAYADLMEEEDDDKVPASPKIPHIVVVSDESNNLPSEVKKLLVELSNRSRAVSIRGLTCGLRAVDAGGNGMPIELNAQAAVKVAMQVDNDAELSYLFSWGRAPKCEEIPGIGFGVGGEKGKPISGFKGPRTKPSTASEVAKASDVWRPDLDAVAIQAGPDWWEHRWDAARETWLAGKQSAQKASASAPQGASAGPSHPSPSGPIPDPSRAGDVAEEAARKAFRDAGIPFPGDAPQEPQGPADDGFDALASDSLSDLQVPRLLTIGRDMAAEEGLVPMADLARRFQLTSRRLGELLRMVGVEPRQSPWRGARAYEQEAFVLVIEGIRSGHLAAPDEVWAASPVE